MSGLTTILCYKWKQPGYRTEYIGKHVNVWCRMWDRHFNDQFRLICVTDDPTGVTECETYPLWPDHRAIHNPNGAHLPRCYARLKMFDPATTRAMGIPDGARVVSCDLDIVILANVTKFFRFDADFAGWKRISNDKPIAYNGTLLTFRAGTMERIWKTFDPLKSPAMAVRSKYFGSDQGWISYCLRGMYPGWDWNDGIFSYSSHILNKPFPKNPRIISFNGRHKPWHPNVQALSPWISEHWK